MKTKPNDPINPTRSTSHVSGDLSVATNLCGLTKREWFTGMSLEGLLSDHDQMRQFEAAARTAAKATFDERKAEDPTTDLEEHTREAFDTMIAFRAVEIADMTIARLNATTEAASELAEKAAPAQGSAKHKSEAAS